MPRNLTAIFLPLLLVGCAGFPGPKTIAEQESGYTYVPVDPFPVKVVPGDGCPHNVSFASGGYLPLLESLPDNAVRMLIEQFDRAGSVTYGPAKVGAKNESYQVTVDYINADTINVPVWISKEMRTVEGGVRKVPLLSPPDNDLVLGSETYSILRASLDSKLPSDHYVEYNIPVYVGIGLTARGRSGFGQFRHDFGPGS